MIYKAKSKASDIIDFNPNRPLKIGSQAPFIDMASISVNNRNCDKIVYKEYKGSGSKFKNGDTIFARITPCLENGKTAKVSGLQSNDIAHGSTEFIVMAAKNPEYDEEYVYYFARYPEFRSYAKTHMEGTSGRQRVPWQALAEFEFEFPAKEKRKSAGNFLKLIDDLIALNIETNRNLELIGQSIFKSWFIDFEPVKAKIKEFDLSRDKDNSERAAIRHITCKSDEMLEVLKHEKRESYESLLKLASLFPSSTVMNGEESIPEGWEYRPLKSFGSIVCGKTPSKLRSEYFGDDIPFIKIPDMHNAMFAVSTNEKLSLIGADSQANKTVTKGSICVSCIATVGKVIIANENSQTNQQINSIIPTNHYLTPFLYYYMLSLENKFRDLASGGSATLNMNTSTFSNIEILKPQDQLIEAFHKTVQPIFNHIESGLIQNMRLGELRDLLLPKLLMGELEV